ncbi:MAG: helix-turn-helix transcriptional regulator [Planctomycetota bacterium]
MPGRRRTADGAAIRKARLALGIGTQRAFADLAGVSERTISNAERGLRLEEKTLMKIAEPLRLPLEEICWSGDHRPLGWENAETADEIVDWLPRRLRAVFRRLPLVPPVPLDAAVADYVTLFFEASNPEPRCIKVQLLQVDTDRSMRIRLQAHCAAVVDGQAFKRIVLRLWDEEGDVRSDVIEDSDSDTVACLLRPRGICAVVAYYAHPVVSGQSDTEKRDWAGIEVEDIANSGPAPYKFAIGTADPSADVEIFRAYDVRAFAEGPEALFQRRDPNPDAWRFSQLSRMMRHAIRAACQSACDEFKSNPDLYTGFTKAHEEAFQLLMNNTDNLDHLCNWAYDGEACAERDRAYFTIAKQRS